MKSFATTLFLLVAYLAAGQEKGQLRLYLSPPAKTVLVNGEVLKYGNKIQLEPGQHSLEAWSPDHQPLDTMVTIQAGETYDFFYIFPQTEAYAQHLRDMSIHSKERTRRFTVPATAVALSAGALAFTYFKGQQIAEDARQKHLDYQYAGTDLESKRADFVAAQDRYRKYYYAQYVEYGLLAASLYFLGRSLYWSYKNPWPEKPRSESPLAVSAIDVRPNRFGGYSLGLNINLN